MEEKNMDELESVNPTDEETTTSEDVVEEDEFFEDDENESEDDSQEEDESDKVARKLYENQKIRAKKAELELKRLKKKLQDGEGKESSQTDSKDDVLALAKLYAKGLEDEQVDKIKKIAKIEGISLDEAYKSDIFQIWDEKRKKEEKLKKSQLRATRGGKVSQKKTLDTPNLSEEEHKQLWKEKMSAI